MGTVWGLSDNSEPLLGSKIDEMVTKTCGNYISKVVEDSEKIDDFHFNLTFFSEGVIQNPENWT